MLEPGFWKKSAAVLLRELATTARGLTSQEAAQRLARYGGNDATAPKRAPAWLRLVKLIGNPLVIILLVASGLSALTGDVASFIIIAAIVLLSVLLDFVQESRAQTAVDALREKVALRADVRRDDAETTLPVAQLVPGDIVRLAAGDLVPADGVLLSTRNLFVNQALLTGESYPVEKHAADQGDPAAEISEVGCCAGRRLRDFGQRCATRLPNRATNDARTTGRHTYRQAAADILRNRAPPIQHVDTRITLVLVVLVMAESMAFHRPWIEALVFALALAVGLTRNCYR